MLYFKSFIIGLTFVTLAKQSIVLFPQRQWEVLGVHSRALGSVEGLKYVRRMEHGAVNPLTSTSNKREN